MSELFNGEDNTEWWLAGPRIPGTVARRIKQLLGAFDPNTPSSAKHVEWTQAVPVKVRECVAELTSLVDHGHDAARGSHSASTDGTDGSGDIPDSAGGTTVSCASLLQAPRLWMAVGALCVIDTKTVATMTEAALVQKSGTCLMCDNHEDGITEACKPILPRKLLRFSWCHPQPSASAFRS